VLHYALGPAATKPRRDKSMKRIWIVLFISAFAAGALPRGSIGVRSALVSEAEVAAANPRKPFDPADVFELLYANRPDSAVALLDSFRRSNPKDAYILVLKAKVLRERLNDEDNNKDLIRRSAEPIHAVLDTAIALANEALDRDVVDHKNYYYRGYAWLNKAQLFVLTKSYWNAGRAASHGKGDLERYLEMYPEDSDANGTLGAYLYFADAIPGFVKILSKLFFIPGGDREKGLEMLRYSTTHEGVMSVDWRFVMAAIDLVFEGNFEKGSAEFAVLLNEYPCYTRLAEPLGVVAPLYPGRTRELRDLADGAVATHLSLQGTKPDWNLVKRMKLVEAFTDTYFGRTAEGLAGFDELVQDPPRHPDWVLPIALVNRAYVLQKKGMTEEAAKDLRAVLANDRMATYHPAAKTLLESIGKPMRTIDLADLDFVGEIYAGDVAEASRLLQSWKNARGEDVLTDFYTGDLEALRGDVAAARRAYESALERSVFGGDQLYQTLSAARLAEIHGTDGRYGDAQRYLERARKYTHANYLLDFLLEARQRYYHHIESGKLEAAPSLLSPHPRGDRKGGA
jgi:tetratricopeptide (TPR) repeat protein